MDSDKKDKIDQGMGGKDETWESRNWRNEDLNRPRHFGPRNTRNDAKIEQVMAEKMKLGKVEIGKRRFESNKTFLPRMGTGWDQDGSEAGIFCL